MKTLDWFKVIIILLFIGILIYGGILSYHRGCFGDFIKLCIDMI